MHVQPGQRAAGPGPSYEASAVPLGRCLAAAARSVPATRLVS